MTKKRERIDSAAKALHSALLPNHPATIEIHGYAEVSWNAENWANLSNAKAIGNPARAWLIATMTAYRAKVQQSQP